VNRYAIVYPSFDFSSQRNLHVAQTSFSVQSLAIMWKFWIFLSRIQWFFKKKVCQNWNLIKKSSRNRQIYKKTHEAFFLSFYIFNGQIWLNWPVNDHHLGYITKLKKNENLKKHCLTPNFNVGKVFYIFEKNYEHIVFIISNWFWWLTRNLFWVGSTGLECTALTPGPSPKYNL
jgi:hypothetical protein